MKKVITVNLTKHDGNIFFILATIRKEMLNYHRKIDNNYDWQENFKQLNDEIENNAKSYDEALQIIMKHINIE